MLELKDSMRAESTEVLEQIDEFINCFALQDTHSKCICRVS